MSAAVIALQEASVKLERERERLQQDLAVARNENNGRAPEIAARIEQSQRESDRITALITELLEEI